MNLSTLLKDGRFRDGVATFGSSYAKRMLEGHYDKLMAAPAGKRLHNLSRPAKLGIEAALNLLAAYMSTHETTLTDNVWKKLAYQVIMDAPSEIAKRLLNGPKALDTRIAPLSTPSVSNEQQLAWETLRELELQTLEPLLSWLRDANDADRQQLADYLYKLVENQRSKSSADSAPEPSTDPLSKSSPARRAAPGKSSSLLSDLANSMARLNEKLERRPAPQTEESGGE